MRPDYDLVAPIYDFLAKLVFGNSLESAKRVNLRYLRQNSRILIVGGGTGRILEYIDGLGYDLEIDFVDLSNAMMTRARKRQTNRVSVNFILSDIIHHRKTNYDMIITNFFFDNYNQPECEQLISQFKTMLNPSGLLLFTDFVKSDRFIDQLLITAMYGFFRIFAKLKKVQLIDHKSLFLGNEFRILGSVHTRAFIVSEAYDLDID